MAGSWPHQQKIPDRNFDNSYKFTLIFYGEKGMRKLLLLAFMTCFGFAASQHAHAQEFITYNFTAEVTQVTDQLNQISDQIQVGDLVTGEITYLLETEPTTKTDRYSEFDLNGAANGLSVTINGLEFKSLPIENPTPNARGLNASIQSIAVTGGAMDSCWHNYNFTSSNNAFPGEPLAMATYIDILLGNEDCDDELDLDKLPGSIDLNRFDAQHRVHISNWDRTTGGYSIVADITSIYTTVEDGGTVSGRVIADYDGDCELDAEDIGLRQRIVKITPGPYYIATDAEGAYEITLPVGKYTAHVNERPLWNQVCPTGPADIDIENKGDEILANFSLQPKDLTEAVSVHLMSSLARPGFEMTYTIRVQNVGTLPYTGDIEFTHDALLTDFASDPAADSYSPTTAVWNLTNFPVDGVLIIRVTLNVPADEELLGTRICASAGSELEDDKGHNDLLRESNDEVCQDIRGAYDPNDMQVFAGTRNANGEILPDDNVLRYLVRFQNEGNEDAITVRVVDALSNFHNIDKIRLGACSHDFVFNFTAEGELEWTFNDINLPAKDVDENGSMGYVSFDVYLNDGLAVGTEIPNSAEIFFDFNSPIVTNTVVSRIVSSTTSVNYDQEDTSILVYPNPSTDKVTVRFDNARPAVLSLRNTLGETLISQSVNAVSAVLDVQHLAAGNYFLTISDDAGITVKPINIVR